MAVVSDRSGQAVFRAALTDWVSASQGLADTEAQSVGRRESDGAGHGQGRLTTF